MIAAAIVAQHAFWIASRAAGVVALVLVSASVLLGLAMAARVPRAPALRRRMLGLHEQLALTALGAIATHALLLLGDPWLHPGAAGIALPFTLPYRPLYTGLGILGGYLAALLALSFYVRRRIGARLWRRLHRLTVLVYALAIVHVLGAGSDASAPWLRAVVFAPALAAAGLLLARAAGRRARRPLPLRARP
jgi:sulfoxide reductase heme-binding subunit YedZ